MFPKTLKWGCQAFRLYPTWMSQVPQGQSILGSSGFSPKKEVLLVRRVDVPSVEPLDDQLLGSSENAFICRILILLPGRRGVQCYCLVVETALWV